jgi:hypothetical protein
MNTRLHLDFLRSLCSLFLMNTRLHLDFLRSLFESALVLSILAHYKSNSKGPEDEFLESFPAPGSSASQTAPRITTTAPRITTAAVKRGGLTGGASARGGGQSSQKRSASEGKREKNFQFLQLVRCLPAYANLFFLQII